ncbi:putative skeletal organic matrix protein 5 [Exaiptasia diaphana]|nr:putative skeletal organic matrix protein 5 [Exaiptasia diaphana]
MKTAGQKNPRWIRLNYKASSLYSVIADGKYRKVTIGRNVWKSLIAGSSLQKNCNKEGFNVVPGEVNHERVRIGISSNNENACYNNDSRIGFGGDGIKCGRGRLSTGNCARVGGDNGDNTTPAHGYILAMSAKSGVYYIKTHRTVTKVYCYMEDISGCGGGGWTTIMKTNGNKKTFPYSSAFWSNKKSYKLTNGQSGVDDKETKLPTYWTLPFKSLCLGMKTAGQKNPRWIRLDYKIGISSNNENDCKTNDSHLGFGGDNYKTNCRAGKISTGNCAKKNHPAYGYILAQ